MTEKEIIRVFEYEGFDIRNYEGTIQVVNTNESNLIDGGKKAIATTSTFSCTNILIYNNDFAYLAHMLPSETVGQNNDFDKRLGDIINILMIKKPKTINILISLGKSIANNPNRDFHNLDYLRYKLSYLAKYCDQNEITLNMLPVLQSKFLLFDLSKQLLYIDNSDKKAIDIKKIEASTTSLTNNDEQKNIIKSH
jgi:hypothetical protein